MGWAIRNDGAFGYRFIDSVDECFTYERYSESRPEESRIQPSEFQVAAHIALGDSDKTILRCVENAVSIPPEWVAYRKALREIISALPGTPADEFPNIPDYPAGT